MHRQLIRKLKFLEIITKLEDLSSSQQDHAIKNASTHSRGFPFLKPFCNQINWQASSHLQSPLLWIPFPGLISASHLIQGTIRKVSYKPASFVKVKPHTSTIIYCPLKKLQIPPSWGFNNCNCIAARRQWRSQSIWLPAASSATDIKFGNSCKAQDSGKATEGS